MKALRSREESLLLPVLLLLLALLLLAAAARRAFLLRLLLLLRGDGVHQGDAAGRRHQLELGAEHLDEAAAANAAVLARRQQGEVGAVGAQLGQRGGQQRVAAQVGPAGAARHRQQLAERQARQLAERQGHLGGAGRAGDGAGQPRALGRRRRGRRGEGHQDVVENLLHQVQHPEVLHDVVEQNGI
ncbi:hypothetical protein EYF80_046826 [Liparis tanakae]|uniref:Uncharacterized protein n=1 Tax=Liparis tanakae TaxID=230148 RepID=A0A4Z2FRG9_9TELE|nr:hypothetical protein EYF80_046826 [Liparis tanakae]